MSTTICSSDEDKQSIIKGSDTDVSVKLTKDEKDFDLTGVTEIEAIFFKEDGTALSLLLSLSEIAVLEAKCGTIKITLSAANSALLKADDNQDFEIVVTIGGLITIFQLLKAIDVSERLIP